MEDRENQGWGVANEGEQDQSDTSARTPSRQSGEHQQVHAVRDLPRPRAITPINLGFGSPDVHSPKTPTSAASASNTQRQTAYPARAPPVPGLKPDPRRPPPPPLPHGVTGASDMPLEREASQTSTGSSFSKLDKLDKSSSEWEVLSESGSRLNEGDGVEELQKKVDKRRSKFQYLENELAELDAQLKAAEERLARAQEAGVLALGEQGASGKQV